MTLFFVDIKQLIVHILNMNRLSIALVCYLLILYIIPAVSATELNREEIINKVTKALNGEGELIGPVVDFRITEYDPNNGTATILVFWGRDGIAELESITLPIVHLDIDNEKVITSYAASKKLNRLSVVGYLDEQYACFVCFAVRVNKLCQ